MDPSSQGHSLRDLLTHADWVRHLAERLVRDPATADDLVQETWLRALRSPGGGPDSKRGSTRPWLAAVLRNVWREGQRERSARARREEQAAAPEALSSSDEQLQAIELQQLLASAVTKLEEPYRSVIVWRYYEGLSSAEIARRQDLPADRVRWRLMRAHELLREHLRRDHGEEWSVRFALLVPASVSTASAPVESAATPTPVVAGAAGTGAAVGSGALVMSIKTLALLALAAASIVGVALWRAAPSDNASDAALSARAVAPAPVSDASTVEPSPLAGAPALPRQAVEALGFSADSAPGETLKVGAVHGTVVAAETGSPLEGVMLYLHEHRDKSEIHGEAQSDESGRFRLESVEPGTYDVSFLVAGRVPHTVSELIVEPRGEHVLDVQLAKGLALTVDVRDEGSGQPVAAAEVLMIAGDRMDAVWMTSANLPFESSSAVTDASGVAVVAALERGTYQVLVRAQGFANYRSETLVRAGRDALVIELAHGGRLKGRVTRADGSPAEGAYVFVNSTRFIRRLEGYFYAQNAVEVDALGDYTIDSIPAGEHYVVVIASDGSGTFHARSAADGKHELLPVAIAANEETVLDLRVPLPATVRGRVHDQDDNPVVGASISVSWGDFKADGAGFFDLSLVDGLKDAIHHSTETDAEGRFEITSLRNSYEPLQFHARAEGYVKDTFEVAPSPGEIVELSIELTHLAGQVAGRLVDESGEPVEGVTVGVWQSPEHEKLFLGHSDASGAYEVAVPIQAPTLEVFPILRDHDAYTSEPEERQNIASHSEGVDFVLHSKHFLTGRVVDEEGEPVRDFEVHMVESASQEYDRQRDVDQGEGGYRIPFHRERHEAALFTAPGFEPTRVPTPAPWKDRDITMRSAPTLGGWIVDSSGNGIAGAIVSLATMDSKIVPYGSESSPSVRTGPDGRFELVGVPESSGGTLLIVPGCAGAPPLVHVPLEGLAGDHVRIEVPRSVRVPVDFATGGGAPVEGTIVVIDSEGWPLDPRVEVGLRLNDDVDESTLGTLVDGRAEFDLSAGDYWFMLLRQDAPMTSFPLTVTLPDQGTNAEPTRFVVDD